MKYLKPNREGTTICQVEDGENSISFKGYEFANGIQKDFSISGNGFYAIKAESGFGKSVFLKCYWASKTKISSKDLYPPEEVERVSVIYLKSLDFGLGLCLKTYLTLILVIKRKKRLFSYLKI